MLELKGVSKHDIRRSITVSGKYLVGFIIKLKTCVLLSKSKVKGQLQTGKEYFISDKGPVSRIYKNFYNSTIR